MKKILLIDAHSLIHRAYHALPPLSAPDGRQVGALYGVSNILLKTLQTIKPDYVAAAFDRPEPTFRKEMFQEYKAHRAEAEDTLIEQIVESRNLFQAFNIACFEKPGFEGDDIIGTLVKKLAGEEYEIVIVTGDLDSLQLVSYKNVFVETPRKGVGEIGTYDRNAVFERFGLYPESLIDYKALVGDQSDNIPGAKGIGPKTAVKLLEEFKTVEGIFEHMQENHPLAKKILDQKDVVLLSKTLATIHTDVPIKIELSNLSYSLDEQKLIPYIHTLGFKSLEARLSGKQPEKHINTEGIEVFTEKNILEKKKLLNSEKIKIAYDWKELMKTSSQEPTLPYFDIHIASWLLNPDSRSQSIESISQTYIGTYEEEKEEQILTLLYGILKNLLKEKELERVYEELELPLISILKDMETNGISIDIHALEKTKKELEKEIEAREKKIFDIAGESFNVRSPQQVAHILFEKLKLIPEKKKKTPGGKISTNEEVLRGLSEKNEIAKFLLEHREFSKMLSTYIEPLQELEEKGIIHTTYLQTGTATGRLSSEKPNLQNLPQESIWSKKIRDAFIARPDHSFLSFDYSQLELRILAHVTKDENLVSAFKNKKDIHRETASKIFDVPESEVTNDMRRIGKTLNFGVVYGMGSKAFSKTSGIPLKESEEFIKKYFEKFPAVKKWQEHMREEVRSSWEVKNENGRIRTFEPKSEFEAQEDERAGMNMPLQSLGADILKMSMIEIQKFIQKERAPIKIILNIHDELLIECPSDILKETAKSMQHIMESVYPMNIPLLVGIKVGKKLGTMESYTI